MFNKTIKVISFRIAEKSANQVCPFLFYQPQLPDKVKKLKK